MTGKKKEILNKAYKEFFNIMLYDHAPERLKNCVVDNVMGYGTTLDEKVFDLSGLENMVIRQKEQGKDIELSFDITPIHRNITANEDIAVYVDEIKIKMQLSEGENEFTVRISTVFEYKNEAWKVIHWHGSKPEHDAEGTDTWHKEEWKQKNKELQKRVNEKTADLENKNRELEIETSLERVRTVAMGMQKPKDLLDICKIISEQLESLNVTDIRNIQVAIIDELKKNYLNYQYFTAYSKQAFEETNYENNSTAYAMVSEMQKSANSFFKGSMKGKSLKEFREWRNTYKQFPDPLLDKSSAVYYYFYSIGQGGLGLTTYKKISGKNLEIFKRFHKVFKLAYQRFKDIESAEVQAREAQIETALERVRAKSMAMHKSEELANLSLELVKQVQTLGVATWFCAFNIYDDDQQGSLEWGSNGEGTFPKYRTPREAIFLHYFEAGQKGETLLINEIGANECPAHYDYLCTLPGVGEQLLKMKDAGIPFPTSQIDHVAFFKYGYILFITFEPATEAHDIFKRFAKIFEQTYTRFLDLQKAEAQAKEARIEAAMERVRAKSMAMHKSEQLPETAKVLFEQFELLGEIPDRIGIVIINKDSKEADIWVTDQIGKQLNHSFKVSLKEVTTMAKLYKAWKEGKDSFVIDLSGQDLIDWLKYTKDDVKLPVDETQIKSRRVQQAAFFSQGMILLTSNEPVADEIVQLLVRFAKVFDQAYTRFLDLQKAEAQAREAQIELSLERIRAQVTAMKESSDLLDIVVTMNAEFKALGHEAHYFWHMRWLPDTYEKAMTSGDGSRIGMVMELPRGFHENTAMLEWEKNDEPVGVFAFDIEGAIDYVDKMIHLGRFSEIDHNAPGPDDIRAMEGLTFVMARTTHGEIGYTLPGMVTNPPEEDLNTLIRFAGVFDLAYRRFEDLKTAERQNRETQIELALERVRSKTMAMHNSNDVGATVVTLFDEVLKLGIDISIRCGIGILDKGTDYMETRSATSAPNSKVDFKMGMLDMTIHPMLIGLKKAWMKGETSYRYDYTSRDVKKYYNALNNEPNYPFQIDLDKLPDKEFHKSFFFSEGILFAFTSNPMSDEAAKVLTRFAGVFGQTYRRYLDLQKAEEQAQEALKQASLDRVRGQIASMRSTSDLQHITPLIWSELEILEVPFNRCGVFILDEIKANVQVYLTTPDGKPLGALNLPFDANELTGNMIKYWRKKKVYTQHWNREDFIKWMESMISIGQIQTRKEYQGDAKPPESLDLHFIPFMQGMLYVGNRKPLLLEKIELVKTLAEAFSIAYARYEDFIHLEEAKNQIENTLTELKSTQGQLIHAEKMASLGELTAGIAHEIQNPLNFVNNFSEVNTELIAELKEEIENGNLEEVKAIADDIAGNEEKINHHGKRADGIVKGMLQHSRSSSDEKEPTDINILADEFLRLSYHGLRAKDKSFNAEFKTDFDENLPKTNVIPQDIGRVLLNLVNNAFYACAERSRNTCAERSRSTVNNNSGQDIERYKPTVTISTKLIGNNVEIKVSDNGNGIPNEVKEKIFQPFFTTKPTGEGTGLGLSLSYDIITKGHGGTLDVDTNQGEGSTFIVYLPIKT